MWNLKRVGGVLGALLFLGSGQVFAQVFGPIHVGKNVHVSAAHSTYSLGEVFLSADPVDAGHLMACAIVYAERENRRWTAVYVSHDGGQTWKNTLETKRFRDSADPACALARNGTASHITIAARDPKYYAIGVFNSKDGGDTWSQDRDMPMKFQGIDNEFMTADTTTGPYSGNVYIGGETSIPVFEGSGGPNGYGLWRSKDGGASYDHPVTRDAGPSRYTLGMGDLKVMRDGTVIMMFGDLLKSDGYGVTEASPGHPNATLEFATSSDGGDSISAGIKATDYYMPWAKPWDSEPSLATDNTNGVFKNRIYAIFGDMRSGRSAMYSIHSSDKGATWSAPVLVDDDVAVDSSGKGPNNFMPTIAVNRNGVVGVAWYDRRKFLGDDGWQERFAASFDGGDTWTGSVPVETVINRYDRLEHLFTFAESTRDYNADAPANGKIQAAVSVQGRQFNAGDYAGLVADTRGTFHAMWIDNRTGLSQIWTAPISVDGIARKFGSPALSSYDDVSDNVSLFIDATAFNRKTNEVTLRAHLVNTGARTLRGPVRLRVLALSSAFAQSAAVIGSENGANRTGALLNIDGAFSNGMLAPKQRSNSFPLRFRLSHVWPLHLNEEPGQVVNLSGQILAHQ